MAKLERLGLIEGWEVRGGLVVGVGSIAEDLEDGEMVCVLWRGGEGLDLGGVEELGEDEGVGGAGCARYEVCGCAG